MAREGWQAHVTSDGERGRVLQLARQPLSVAEISAQLELALDAAKALVEDLLAAGALRTTAPADEGDTPSRGLMLAVLEGLKRL